MTAIISNADLYVQGSISSFHLGVPQALPTQHFQKNEVLMSLFIVSHYYPLRGNLLCRSCSESWIMASPPISLGVSLCYFFFFTHSILVSKRCQFLGNVPQIHTLFSTLTIHYLNFTSL